MVIDLTVEEKEVAARLAKPSGFVQGLTRIGDEPVVLDPWQADICDTERRFSIWNKARQVGWSFAIACRAWARCYLSKSGTYLAIFSSYNLEDAKEKIRYVKLLDECLPREARLGGRAAAVWSKTELEFSNGNRIVTMFRIRGKGPADVFLDEHAHMEDGRERYQASLPVISRGGGIFDSSTPLSRHGTFADIWKGTDGKFRKFKRIEIPWWRSSALCTDVGRARKEAPAMSTEERVGMFGTEVLQDILDNIFLEDFQTEYECAWSDESQAGIPWELIIQCSPTGDEDVVKVVSPPVRGYRAALDAVDYLHSKTRGDLYAGADIGRKINATEIRVGEQMKRGGAIEERLAITLERCPFPKQQEVMARLCSLPRVRRVVIDAMGIGAQLAEQLQIDYRNKVVAQVLSRTTKPEIFNHTRMMMEKNLFQFYPDGDTRRQFHSIKKTVTFHGNVTYDVDRNEKHHADKFWAAALMLWGAKDSVGGVVPKIFILGGREEELSETEVVLPHGITVDPRTLR